MRDLWLAALGAASLGIYAWLLPNLTWLASGTRMPVAGSLPFALPAWLSDPGPTPALTADSASQLHAATAVDLSLALTALYVLYLMAVRAGRGRPSVAGVLAVLGVAVLFQALMIVSPYSLSGDVFSYGSYGRIYAVYGGSPYLETPAEYPADPFTSFVYWKHVPSFYGPLWTLISGQVALLAGSDVGLAVLLFRTVAGGGVLASSLLAFLLLRHIDPERALAATLLIAWSPLAIVESGLGAHNDVLMGLLIVLGLLLAWQRQWWFAALSVGAVVLAGLVKATALALLPLLGIYLLRKAPDWRARSGTVVMSAVLAAGLSAAIVWPVWVGPDTFAVGTLGSGADRYVNSLAEPVLGEIRAYLGVPREALEIPLQFKGWWVGTHRDTQLYAARSGDEVLAPVPAWTSLVVVGPEREGRLRIYDPEELVVGYVDAAALGPIGPPPEWAENLEVQARLQGPVGSLELQQANRWIRTFGWGAFALAFVVALVFGTRTAAGLTLAWVGVCLVLDYLTLTWFWPWYVLWGLMPAALIPRTRLTRLTVYLGWGVLMGYALMGFQDSRFWYLHNYRAVWMFGLPLVLFVADDLMRGVTRTGRWAVRRARGRVPIAIGSRRQSDTIAGEVTSAPRA